MHIVHVISSLGYGGAEQLLYDQLKNFNHNKNKHSVIYLRHGHHVEKIESLGIQTFGISGLITRYDPIALSRLYLLIKELDPDVIHSALPLANIFARLVGRMLRVPVINDYHGDCSFHGWFRNTLDRATVRLATSFVAVSYGVAKSLMRHVFAGKKRLGELHMKTVVIQNGIDCAQVNADASNSKLTREKIGLHDNDFIIGAVGRLKPIKGFDVLLKSFALFQSMNVTRASREDQRYAKLVIIGDGPERQHLEHLAVELNISNDVYFLGYVVNARTVYHLFDCFAISSKSEGLSIAMLEAMCSSVPVVSTHAESTHDVIVDQKNGMLVPVGDIKALAQCFYTLKTDAKIAQTLAENARATVESKFTIKQMIEQYELLYEEVSS